jgi:hypothetical protein
LCRGQCGRRFRVFLGSLEDFVVALIALDQKLGCGEVETQLLGCLGDFHAVFEDLSKEICLILGKNKEYLFSDTAIGTLDRAVRLLLHGITALIH